MNLISLSAKARCGKDTAADYIRGHSHLNATTYALASPFKESIASHFADIFTHADVFGTGVDRNTHIFYIDGEEVKRRVKHIFLDFGYDLDDYNIVWPHQFDSQSWTIREIMQIVGTDIGCNQVDQMIWVKLLDEKLFNIEKLYDTVIITDCRQDHEMSHMRNLGAKVLHIHRDTGIQDTHSTEAGLPVADGDWVIENNGTLDEYYEALDSFIASI